MNERGKSDNLVVPAKLPNNAGELVAEVVEGRRLAEGNTASSTRPGRSAGSGMPNGLDRVREVARRDKEARFTALLHHVDLDRLWAAYVAINPKAAPGVDQVTWDAYGQDLRENLEDLLRRVHSGAYRASPSRRVYIPKRRTGGSVSTDALRVIATLEDKIVQRAVVEVLNAIYEEDFLGFSYGFRPGRSPHDALDALSVGISRKKVNYVLDADISDFFSKLDHSWLEKFLGHRIADKRVLRLIRKWMRSATAARADRGRCCSPATSASLGRCIPDGRSLRRVSGDTQLVVCEPVGDLPAAWNKVSGASFRVIGERHGQLLSLTRAPDQGPVTGTFSARKSDSAGSLQAFPCVGRGVRIR